MDKALEVVVVVLVQVQVGHVWLRLLLLLPLRLKKSSRCALMWVKEVLLVLRNVTRDVYVAEDRS